MSKHPSTLTTEQWIQNAIKIHGSRFDYSKTIYINSKTKVTIICKEHGEFQQSPGNHTIGFGCKKCTGNHTPTREEFIEYANKVHNNKYDYSKSVYKNTRSKMIINCPIHGEFQQSYNVHTSQGCGCPKCKKSKGEEKIRRELIAKGINFIEQHWFADCRDIKPLPFDFYLPEYNCCIEYDGVQHHKPFSWSSDKSSETKLKNLQIVQHRDAIKTNYCAANNILLVRLTSLDI
jgi:hypothetical protein